MAWWGYLLLGLILSAAITFVQGQILLRFPTLSVWVLAPLLFTLAKLTGDLLLYICWYSFWWPLFRHFLQDTLSFILLGLAAAGTLQVAAANIGGRVMPALPAVLTYLLFLHLSQRERRRR